MGEPLNRWQAVAARLYLVGSSVEARTGELFGRGVLDHSHGDVGGGQPTVLTDVPAIPKSASTIRRRPRSGLVSRMFCGLTSRCSSPRECARNQGVAHRRRCRRPPRRHAVGIVFCSRRPASGPSMKSIEIHSCPLKSPRSWMPTICGFVQAGDKFGLG